MTIFLLYWQLYIVSSKRNFVRKLLLKVFERFYFQRKKNIFKFPIFCVSCFRSVRHGVHGDHVVLIGIIKRRYVFTSLSMSNSNTEKLRKVKKKSNCNGKCYYRVLRLTFFKRERHFWPPFDSKAKMCLRNGFQFLVFAFVNFHLQLEHPVLFWEDYSERSPTVVVWI